MMRLTFRSRDPGTARALADRLIADRRRGAFLKDMRTRIRWASKACTWVVIATMLYMAVWRMFQPSEQEVREQAEHALLAMLKTHSTTRQMPTGEITGSSVVQLASAEFYRRGDGGYSVDFSFEDGNLIASGLEKGACDFLTEDYPQIDAEGPDGPSNLSCADDVLAIAIGRLSK